MCEIRFRRGNEDGCPNHFGGWLLCPIPTVRTIGPYSKAADLRDRPRLTDQIVEIGRDGRIRTGGPLTPSQVRYQAALHPVTRLCACVFRFLPSAPFRFAWSRWYVWLASPKPMAGFGPHWRTIESRDRRWQV